MVHLINAGGNVTDLPLSLGVFTSALLWLFCHVYISRVCHVYISTQVPTPRNVSVINLTNLPLQLGLFHDVLMSRRRYLVTQPEFATGSYAFMLCSDGIDPLDLAAVDWVRAHTCSHQ